MKHSPSRLPMFAGIVSLALGAMAIACTAAPTGGVPGGNDDDSNKQESNATSATPSKSNNNSTSNSGSTPSNPTPSNPTSPDASTPLPGTDAGTTPTPTDPGVCAASADFNACVDCCDQANPGGFEVSDQAWGDCVCQTPGVCAQACGNNFCAGGQPSAACEQCLDNNTQQCDQAADAACQANAACAGAMACFKGSQCDQKP